MTVLTLLRRLQIQGIEPRLRNGRFKLVGPANRITPDLLAAAGRHKAELLAYLCQEQEGREVCCKDVGGGYKALPPDRTPAYSLLETCRRYGVTLRIDDGGDVVVGKAGAKADEPTQPWPSLLMALEAHVDEVAELIEAGWTLNAAFPDPSAA